MILKTSKYHSYSTGLILYLLFSKISCNIFFYKILFDIKYLIPVENASEDDIQLASEIYSNNYIVM